MARILIKDLSVDTDYWIQVRSMRDGAVSEWSQVLAVRTVKDLMPPGPVTNLNFDVVGSNFVATWEPPTENEDGSDLNGDLKDYQVILTYVAQAQTMTRELYTLMPRFELTAEENKAMFYEYAGALTITVRARDFANNMMENGVSDTAVKAKPNPVTDLDVIVKGTSFVATWTPPTQNTDGTPFEDLKHYKVTITDGTYSESFTTTDPTYTATFDQIKSIFGAMRYSVTFRVSVVNAIGGESTTVEDLVTKPAPGPPTGLTWVSVGDAFAASWTAPTGVDDLDGYDVTVTANSLSTTYRIMDTKFELSAEENGRIFTTGINRTPQPTVAISVKSVDSLGQRSLTAATATASNPVPAAPTSLTGVALYDAIELSWVRPTLNVDGSNFDDLRYYEVQVSSDGTTFSGSWYLGTDPQYTHLTVSATNHYFRVRVYDKFMQASAWSNTAGPFKPKNAIQVNTTNPDTPTGLTAVPITFATTGLVGFTLDWNPVANPENDLAGYTVRYRKTGSTVYEYADFPPDVDLTTNLPTITGLAENTGYTLDIRAYDFTANRSPWSTPAVTATTSGGKPVEPKTDSTVPASSPAATVNPLYGALEVRWPPIANADPVTYEVHISTAAIPNQPTEATKAVEVDGTFAIIRTLPGGGNLAYGTTYNVRVRAKDADGPAASAGTNATGVPLAVDNGDLAAGAVRTNHLYAGAVTADKVNITFGGGNLWSNGSFENTVNYFAGWSIYSNDGIATSSKVAGRLGGFAARISWSATSTWAQGLHRALPGGWKANQWYSLSFWARGSGDAIGRSFVNRHNTQPQTYTWVTNPPLTADWQRYTTRFRYSADTTDPTFWGITGAAAVANYVEYDDIKVEEGEIASGYSNMIGEVLPGTITATEIAGNSIATGHISTNGLDAGVLTANSTFTKNLNVGAVFTMAANGEIKSSNYGGTTGYQLTTSGLTILSGTIAARALQIQEGSNMVAAPYAGFEFVPSFYTGNLTATGGTWAIDTTVSKFETQSLRLTNTNAAGAGQAYFFLSPSATNYNIAVEAGMTYIMSVYAYQNSGANINVQMHLRQSNAVYKSSPSTSIPSGVWTRITDFFTIDAGISTANLRLDVDTEGATAWFDGVQLEPQITGATTPSAWKPPGITRIDGGVIRTGEIRSTTNVTHDGTTQPAWSINVQGGMQLNDALVRGKLIVGTAGTQTNTSTTGQTGGTLANQGIFSGTYGGTGAQWAIKGDGVMEFRSGASGASRIEFDGTGLRAWSGTTKTVDISSTGAAAFAGNLSGSTISNNGGTFAVDTAGSMTAKSGSIGGWTITTNTLQSGGLVLYTPENMIYAGDGVNRIGMKAGVGFWAGSESQNSSAPFFVSQTGVLTANNAVLRGTFGSGANGTTSNFTVDASGNVTASGNMNVYGHIEVGASSTSTDAYAIVRRPGTGEWVMLDGRWNASNPAQYPYAINSSSGNFTVDYYGNMTAKTGSVGGWTINSTSLSGGSASLNSNGSMTVGSKFSVSTDGTLSASGATVSGSITANAISAGATITSPVITGGTFRTSGSGYNVRLTDGDVDAIQFVNGNTSQAEIRGTMPNGNRGLYLNVDTAIGNTQSILYQYAKRKAHSNPPTDVRVRAGSFSITGAGRAWIGWASMSPNVPNCVLIQLDTAGARSNGYTTWVDTVSVDGCYLNWRYNDDGATPGSGGCSGYYYAEVFV